MTGLKHTLLSFLKINKCVFPLIQAIFVINIFPESNSLRCNKWHLDMNMYTLLFHFSNLFNAGPYMSPSPSLKLPLILILCILFLNLIAFFKKIIVL